MPNTDRVLYIQNLWHHCQYIVYRQLQAVTRNIQVLASGASYISDFTVDIEQ